MQAILASTSVAAHLIGTQDRVGTIEKGKLAISCCSREIRFVALTCYAIAPGLSE